jgi:hypothetical protein
VYALSEGRDCLGVPVLSLRLDVNKGKVILKEVSNRFNQDQHKEAGFR